PRALPPPATHTLSLHDALPIYGKSGPPPGPAVVRYVAGRPSPPLRPYVARPIKPLPPGYAEFPLFITAPESSQKNVPPKGAVIGDRKSTRLNSSHVAISYAVFC